MTLKQYQRKKISKICSYEAYIWLQNWIAEYRERKYPEAAKTGYFTIKPEEYFYKNTLHREYFSKFLESVIVDVLNKSGHIAKKVETAGVPIVAKSGKTIRVPGNRKVNKGEPDVFSLINGKMVYWEVKIGADRLSADQKIYIERVEKSGGIVFVVKTVDEFIKNYSELCKQ